MGNSNVIGDRIELLRKEKNETQSELAKALHVKRETVNQWENGTRDLKTEYTIALSKHFNTSTDYLLGLTEIQKPDTNLQAIQEFTGLSEKAINNLHEWNTIWDSEKIKTVTALIDSAPWIIENLSKFLYGEYRLAFPPESDELDELNEPEHNPNYLMMVDKHDPKIDSHEDIKFEDLNYIFLTKIQNELITLRKKIHKSHENLNQ